MSLVKNGEKLHRERRRQVNIQWIFQVPVKGGRDYITHQKAIYKWYILPIGGLYATYHPLKEPEKSIEICPSHGASGVGR